MKFVYFAIFFNSNDHGFVYIYYKEEKKSQLTKKYVGLFRE